MLFLSQLINGLQLGSIYALVALGYSMVYGIIMLLNFAHGDIIMMGGYFALVSLAASSNPVLAVIATLVGCVVLAVVIEKGGSGAALAETAVNILNAYFTEEETVTPATGENALLG